MANKIRTSDPVDSIKDVVWISVKVLEFDKHLKKAGGYIGRNVVKMTIRMKTIVRKPLMIRILTSLTMSVTTFYWAYKKEEDDLIKCLLTFLCHLMWHVSDETYELRCLAMGLSLKTWVFMPFSKTLTWI